MSEGAENRKDTRRSVYLGEGIKVYVKDEEEKRSINGEITDLSPWGINIYIIDQKLSTYPKKSEIIKIYYITRDKKKCCSKGRVIYIFEEVIDEVNYLRYGVEFIHDNKSESLPNLKSYEIPEIFTPHCWCDDPFFFQEKIIFKIQKINAKGMTLFTSARNKTLLPNLQLQLKVSIPTCDEFLINITVTSVNFNKSNDKDKYSVDVKFENPNSRFLQVMVEYILFSGVEVTPKELRNDNLPVDIIENSLTYFYAKDPPELEKVMILRQNSLFDEGIHNIDNVKDKYDDYSRQLVCKVGRKSIACIRIIFNNKDKNKSEINSFIDEIPEWIWNKKFVEISKFAWDKEFRESDVFINMIRQIVRIVIESGHTHIFTSAPPLLKDLYLKVGFLPIKLNWKSNFVSQKDKESTLLLDAKGILTGEVVIEKFIWNKIYSRVAKYLGISQEEN
ncbi:hypothetical protein [Silvanigrella aquatica]|uniref:PilZ domain-containing protein n=1 Tax=Silvanigrella aquatica TaxID=1915309 RepID=A0A1L4CZ01_9BACT|nr:hypothetical protein [Silvanigrella aquatica]APJ03167.1 hypothetical protein AXG55_04315 [Silvanigrella aquatica]